MAIFGILSQNISTINQNSRSSSSKKQSKKKTNIYIFFIYCCSFFILDSFIFVTLKIFYTHGNKKYKRERNLIIKGENAELKYEFLCFNAQTIGLNALVVTVAKKFVRI